MPRDYPIFLIDGEPAVDAFVRHECLHADLEQVCDRLRIPWDPERLGKYKSEYRARPEHFSEYYDSHTVELIRSAYPWELAHFPYRCEA